MGWSSAAKEAGSALVARICADFNLTPVLALAPTSRMSAYLDLLDHALLRSAPQRVGGRVLLPDRMVQAWPDATIMGRWPGPSEAE